MCEPSTTNFIIWKCIDCAIVRECELTKIGLIILIFFIMTIVMATPIGRYITDVIFLSGSIGIEKAIKHVNKKWKKGEV